jgi:PilX N-terminal
MGGELGTERGTALVFTLLITFTLLGLSIAGLLSTISDLKMSGNYQTGTQALLDAESGILHAQEKIDEVGVINFQTDIVANWSSIFGTSAVTVQGYPLLNYSVTASNDTVDPAHYMLLNSTGQAPNESLRSIQARLTVNGVFSPGAIYLPGSSVNPNFNGNSFLVDGHDTNLNGTSNPSGDVPGIGTSTQSTAQSVTSALSSQQANNVIGQGGVPSVNMTGGFSSSTLLNEVIPGIVNQPGVVTNPTLNGNDTFGTCSQTQTAPQITHFTGNVTVNGNLSGCGILVVDQGLTISGSSTFTGLIIVQGTTQITTVQGNTTILGALWTTDVQLTVGGSASLTYSSEALALANALQSNGLLPQRVKVVAWGES